MLRACAPQWDDEAEHQDASRQVFVDDIFRFYIAIRANEHKEEVGMDRFGSLV